MCQWRIEVSRFARERKLCIEVFCIFSMTHEYYTFGNENQHDSHIPSLVHEKIAKIFFLKHVASEE